MDPLRIGWFEIRSDDVAEAERFLVEFCGWRTSPFIDYDPEYLLIHEQAEQPSGALLDAHSDAVGGGTTLFVEVGDLEQAIGRATALRAAVVAGPTDIAQSGGRFAIVKTPGGMTMGLWSPGDAQPSG